MTKARATRARICQFLIVLPRTEPLVWRRIEVPEQLPASRGAYPRCIAGAGACPPEDVGGVAGYAEFLRAMAAPRHPERAALLEWAGGGFDPHAFDPRKVKFDDSAERWKIAFGGRPAGA